LQSVPSAADVIAANSGPPFDWAQATAAAIGTVTHRLLAQLAHDGISAWQPERVAAQRGRVVVDLAAEGVDPAARAAAADRVLDAVTHVLTDACGQWLFDPAHTDAVSEWALAAQLDGSIVHVSLDRTFIADGVRWIVDFKTGRHEGGATDAFLAREVDRYRPQLERYARIVQRLDPRPIRLALYFPLVEGGWRTWPFAVNRDTPERGAMR
jgi:ATP-dependent exoDNAse (exonuclease V) beta subunit